MWRNEPIVDHGEGRVKCASARFTRDLRIEYIVQMRLVVYNIPYYAQRHTAAAGRIIGSMKGSNPLGHKSGKNHGREIGDILQNTLRTGDLSHLGKLGPAIGDTVKDAVKGIPNLNTETRREEGPAPYRPAAQPPPPPPARPPWQGRPAGQRQAGPAIPGGLGRMLIGGLGLGLFGIGALISLGLALAVGTQFWPLCIGFGLMGAAGAGLLGSGRSRGRLKERLQKYYAILAQNPVRTYDELAAATGSEPKQIKRDIKAARRVAALPDVKSDAADTMLICGDEAWQHYQASVETQQQRAAEEAERRRRLADPATAGIEAFRSEGAATIRQIREANEAIPGEEISRKLDKLEATCARIFALVEQHPDKLPDTRKFMSYYLPTTLKLVKKYRQYEEMPDPPPNVLEAKREIEDSLDTIDAAFNKLRESLYAHDTLDVSTDITVMKKMLEQEGLVGQAFEIGEEEKGIRLE